MKIACLHTADSNIAVFDRAAASLGIKQTALFHIVRADLLDMAEQEGGLTPDIIAATQAAIKLISQNTDIVILTCSTLGPAVENCTTTVPILRTDHALAQQATKTDGRVIVLCATQTTLMPTTALFAQMLKGANTHIEFRLVSAAWALFKAGKTDEYLTLIAQAADDAYNDGADCVALAQASMAEAATRVKNGPMPLTSPMSGLVAAVSILTI